MQRFGTARALLVGRGPRSAFLGVDTALSHAQEGPAGPPGGRCNGHWVWHCCVLHVLVPAALAACRVLLLRGIKVWKWNKKA